MELFLKYLLIGFKEPSFQQFTFSSGEISDNPLYRYAEEIFEDRSQLHPLSSKIASYLYNNSQNANIKAGELIVCYFEDLLIDDEMLDGIGVFKSETKDAFLKMIKGGSSYDIRSDEGLAIGNLDKGCVILNTDKPSGYKICLLDKSNQTEAQFWSKDFLNVKERQDDYHYTTHYMQLTKDYVEDRKKSSDSFGLQEELAVMNASEKMFKSSENFSEQNFMEELSDLGVASDFKEFKGQQQRESGVYLQPDFEISQAAVKKNNGVFKSVIKLDKNFHLYVHGDRSLIERGEDEYGRKFYKLYYEEES